MRVIVITFTAFALLIGGYSFWWNSLAEIALAQVEGWKARQKETGYVITNTPPEISGFPYRVKLDIKKTVIENPSRFESYSATIHDIWAVVQPWKVNHVIFGIESPFQLFWMNKGTPKTATVSATKAFGSALFNNEGSLQNMAIDLTDVKATGLNNGPSRAERVQIHKRPALTPAIADDTPQTQALQSGQYALTVDNLFLGERAEYPLGDTVEKIEILARLEGSLRDFQSKESILQWRDRGGVIDIEDAVISWGISKVSGNGTLTLDNKSRPMGAFSTKLVGFNSLLDLLARSGGLDPRAQKTAGFALNLLAKQDSDGVRYLDIPLSLQDGGLYLGPLFLMPIKSVF
ncbi:MAG: DUF2125 domain-containing protein [Sneathiella sp.]|nr:DUF2125 domain-containing protein [Sneathiella sp.]